MAKILLGPTVIGIRGTVGGITFSQNRGGPYARGWHQPPNPRTSNQLLSRSRLGTWAVAWRSLSSTNKGLWDTYAADVAQELTDSLGQAYYASGLNWFITVNIARAQMGLGQLSAAPTVAVPAAPNVEAASFSISSSSQPKVKIAAGSATLTLNHQCWLVIVNSQGQTIAPTNYYWMRTGVPNASRDLELRSFALAKFGTFTINQRAFFATNALNSDGRYGPTTYNAVNAVA